MKLIFITLPIVFIFFFNHCLVAGDANFTSSARAKTLSLNGMYFAGADGLQSMLGNPSMLSLLNSKGFELYIIDHMGQYEFENMHNNLFESFRDDDFSLGGGIFWSFSPFFSAAISFQRAFDYRISWPFANLFVNGSSSSLLAFDFFNEITADAASAAFAYKFDNISVGASVHLYYLENHASFPVTNNRWDQGLGQAAYQFAYNQDGYSFGFNLGASLQLNDQLRIGIMSKSAYKTDLEGSALSNMFSEIDSNTSAAELTGNFEMPWIFGSGLIYEWTENLKLNFDLQFNLWDGIQKTFDLNFNNPVWQENLSSMDSLTGINAASFNLSFDNSIDAGFGIEYNTSGLVLRTGYRFSQSPNTEATYNLLFPSVDQHWISLGLGYHDGSLLIDAVVAYAFGISKKITATGRDNLSGKYSSSTVLPAVTFRYLL